MNFWFKIKISFGRLFPCCWEPAKRAKLPDSRPGANNRSEVRRFLANVVSKTFFVGCLVLPMAIFAQETEIDSLARRFETLELRYGAAQAEAARLSAQADSLAREIKKQKRRKNPNLLQSRALEDALQFSSRLNGALESARREEGRFLNALIQFSSTTFEKLNSLTEQLGRAYNQEKEKNRPGGRAVLTENIRKAQDLRRRCQAYLDRVPSRVPIIDVNIEPSDSPEEASQKIDFLLDQADRLEKAASQAKQRGAEIRSVADLGARMSDFVEDLSLLDPGNERGDVKEAASQSRNLNAPAELAVDDEADFGQRENADDKSSNDLDISNTFFNPAGSASADFSSLSPVELQKLLDDLRDREKLWKAQADSLKKAARKFRKWNDARKEQ